MWYTLENGRRVQVRKEDVELLLCAKAQGNVEGSIYAALKIIANSKQLVREMAEDFGAFMEQWKADAMGLGING